jgi:nucleotide-binding universal stress UspA family protein
MHTAGVERTVVAGVDGSECALQAVRWAAAEASRRRVPLRLVSAYAWPVGRHVSDPGLGLDYRDMLCTMARDHLTTAAQAVVSVAPGLEVEQVAVQGSPVPALLAASARAGVLVLGRRGSGGFAGLMTGSVAEHLVAHADCPVVVVRESASAVPASPDAPVVLGVDGSPTGEAAIAFAFDTAARWGAPLVAVHAWSDMTLDPPIAAVLDFDPVDEKALLAERLAGWGEKYPEVSVRRHVVRDRPASALVAESNRARLVVVGSRGRGGLAGMLLGSVSRAVLHHAHCPVAVVRLKAQP